MYVGLPALILATLLIAPWLYRRWFLPDDSWPSFSAQVLATRIVRLDAIDNMYGNSLLYRVEVHAAWTENGVRRQAWVPTRMIGSDESYLELWASRQQNHCTVRVSPRNPQERIAFFVKAESPT